MFAATKSKSKGKAHPHKVYPIGLRTAAKALGYTEGAASLGCQ